MLRIGEFSVLSSISINMLRNYDKIGLLVPQYVDDDSGYRYYDKSQLLQANQIIALKSMGFGLEKIKEIILSNNINIYFFLNEKLQEKCKELHKIQEQISLINMVVNAGESLEKYAFSIVQKIIPAKWVVFYRGNINEYNQEGILWNKLGLICRENNIVPSNEACSMAVYHGIEEKTGSIDIEVQIPIDQKYSENEQCVAKIEQQEVASIVFKGAYSQIGLINSVVAQWLESNNFEICGNTFSIYHNSPGNCNDFSKFITELCFPIKKVI